MRLARGCSFRVSRPCFFLSAPSVRASNITVSHHFFAKCRKKLQVIALTPGDLFCQCGFSLWCVARKRASWGLWLRGNVSECCARLVSASLTRIITLTLFLCEKALKCIAEGSESSQGKGLAFDYYVNGFVTTAGVYVAAIIMNTVWREQEDYITSQFCSHLKTCKNLRSARKRGFKLTLHCRCSANVGVSFRSGVVSVTHGHHLGCKGGWVGLKQ